ncbi:hypothetical protein [Lentzea sp. NPDC004782]|uniref:hypothetical protein n=1 Tax=Lentzea sp. NPDC004782 TaxID=3154458 RepID=UPI0033B7B8A9
MITVVVAAAAITTACGANPGTDQKATTVSTPTTTSDVAGADPAAWFEAYCGPMGAVEVARSQIGSNAAQGREAVKDAVVAWASLAAASDRKAADDLEKLGPMGSDVRNPHDRLIESLRVSAKGFEEASGRLRTLAADETFPERYRQVMATSGDTARENAEAMFKQILGTPKYAEAFRETKVCANWQALAKGK